MSTSADATEPEVASFAGEILLQRDAGGLAVDLRVTESRVTLRSGMSELGAWPASGVSITPLGNGTYDFLAEGDQLTFIPSDPSAFATNPLIALLVPLPPPRRWRIRKPRAAGPVTADGPKPKAKSQPAKPDTAKDEPKPEPKSRRTKPDTGQDERAEAPRPAVDRPKRKLRIRRVKREPDAVRLPEDQGATPHDDPVPAAAPRASQPKPQAVAAVNGTSRRSRAWLATLDQARQYDLFGLDRVPVTRRMRQEAAHKHTWDHRVSAGFASRHVCTICGKLRISSR
jgi:hypothetical protein